jgi:hypothetical protein
LFCFLSIQHQRQSRKPELREEIFYLNAFLKQTNGLLLLGDGVRRASIDFHSSDFPSLPSTTNARAKKCVKVFTDEWGSDSTLEAE